MRSRSLSRFRSASAQPPGILEGMTADLDAVLAYMVSVADADESRGRAHVGRVVWLGWQGFTNPLRLDGNVDTSGVRELVAMDGLHREEHLIWQGCLWLIGTHGDRTFRFPILRRRVRAGPLIPRGIDRVIGAPYQMYAETDWQYTPGLVSPYVLDDFLDRGLAWSPSLPSAQKPQINRADNPALVDFIRDYLGAAELPRKTPLMVEPGSESLDDRDLSVVLATAFYLDRHPYRLDRASVLKIWQTHDLRRTAMGHLYAPMARARRQAPDIIRSPMPLNDEQQLAITRSRVDPLVVVSGPPGTGKSHLLAAAAIDEVSRGGSVLIATQSIHASEVLHDFLTRFPMVEALRFGDTGSARALGDRLAAGVPVPDARFDPGRLATAVDEVEVEIARQQDRIRRRLLRKHRFDAALRDRLDMPVWLAERGHDDLDLAEVRRAIDDLHGDGFLAGWNRRRARARLRARLGPEALRDVGGIEDVLRAIEADRLVTEMSGREPVLTELWDQLEDLEDRWRGLVGDLMEADRRARAGRRARAALGDFAAMLRESTTIRRQQLAGFGARFLDVAPLWIGTLGEIEATLPITPGLFDLVVVRRGVADLPALGLACAGSGPARTRGRRQPPAPARLVRVSQRPRAGGTASPIVAGDGATAGRPGQFVVRCRSCRGARGAVGRALSVGAAHHLVLRSAVLRQPASPHDPAPQKREPGRNRHHASRWRP